MALSANKHRAKEMKRLGWVWWDHYNSWIYLGYMDAPKYTIDYQRGGAWLATSVEVGIRKGSVTFDCPIAAAIWISVEYADEIAADKERQERGWQEHVGYALQA